MRLNAAALVIAMVVSACAPAEPTPSARPSVASTSTPSGPVDPAAQPPSGSLSVDGGDPVPGALGAYEWLETGSASPWLPGAPITVGRGEVARMALEPPLGIASWRARAATQLDGDDARRLADGLDQVSFGVPEPGEWTIEITVQFAGGVGSASYYWRMTVQ